MRVLTYLLAAMFLVILLPTFYVAILFDQIAEKGGIVPKALEVCEKVLDRLMGSKS